MKNPYLDEFEELQEKNTFKGEQWFGERQDLVESYSWAIPSDEVLMYLAEFDHIVEVGAGSGYWAYCINEAGGNVTATDASPPQTTWTDVKEAGVNQLGLSNKVVLTVWPPYADRMASDLLEQRPKQVLYVGEQRGGCTGDDRFFEVLEAEYGLVARIELPSYAGVHDDFYHYSRNV